MGTFHGKKCKTMHGSYQMTVGTKSHTMEPDCGRRELQRPPIQLALDKDKYARVRYRTANHKLGAGIMKGNES